MKTYLDLLKDVRDNGKYKKNRTNVNTYSVFGRQMRFDLKQGFPLLTTKKIHTKSLIHELLWIISGNTNIKYLKENGVRIWDEWAGENGDLGPVYGKQWRHWENPDGNTIDQLANAINLLKCNPDSRRIIVTAWNPSDLPKQKLAPCHCFFQFNTEELTQIERIQWMRKSGTFDEIIWMHDNEKYYWKNCKDKNMTDMKLNDANVPTHSLSCQLYQRSADLFLGVPFNIASYSLLTEMIAQVVNMVPNEFIWTGGDVHLYENHLEQVDIQLQREPMALPTLKLNKTINSIDNFSFNDIEIVDYNSHPTIKATVAI